MKYLPESSVLIENSVKKKKEILICIFEFLTSLTLILETLDVKWLKVLDNKMCKLTLFSWRMTI